MDLMEVITQGMRQLQEAQLRVLDRKSESADPETFEAGGHSFASTCCSGP